MPEPNATQAAGEATTSETTIGDRPTGEPLLSVRDLVQEFTVRERGGV
jgi:hypothetical protein